MNKKTKYATGTFYKLLFLILFLCCTSLNILGVNYPIDSTGVSLIHPSNIVGKSIVFTEPSKSYIANCFYVEEAINHNKYSKKWLLSANDTGETPKSEYLNHSFKVLDLIYLNAKDTLLSDGFVLKLKRDDGITIGLKFNKYKPNKLYEPKGIPSFTDFFIKSNKKSMFLSYYSGSVVEHTTDVYIEAYDLDNINNYINSINKEYVESEQFASNIKVVDNYSLDSISYNNSKVLIYLKKNNSHDLCLTPWQLKELNDKRNQDISFNIRMNEYITKYDQDELLYIKEKLLGKELWVYSGIMNYAKFIKSIDEPSHKSNVDLWRITHYNRLWFNPNSNTYGSGITKFETMFMNTMNNYYSASCIIEDMVISENCLIGRIRNSKEIQGTLADNDYCLYLVLKQNTNKDYFREGVDMKDTLMRVYIMVENGISKKFVSDIENKLNIEKYHSLEQQMAKEMNERFNNIYIIAKRLWGEEIANLIQHGEVRFGFNVDMCLMAYRDEPYRISKVSIPLGLATCYNFFERDVKLYFINEELIGIQFKLEDIHYY